MNEKLTLKEFVSHAQPVVDENFEHHPLFSLWEKYMATASDAFANARQAFKRGDEHAAYWNALQAIGSYAAAHAAVTKDDAVAATGFATFAYLGAIAGARSSYPHLYRRYARLKPTMPILEKSSAYKVKPILRWKDQEMYCGGIRLAAYSGNEKDGYQVTFEFTDLVYECYDREFEKHWEAEQSKGKSITEVLEEIYREGFELIAIKGNPRDGSWKYELDWDVDVFGDTGDERVFLLENGGNLFLGNRYIGILTANERNEYIFDPFYFRDPIFAHAKDRLLSDGRLIVPAQVNPRDVVEAIMQDVLKTMEVELVPR